MSVIDDPLALMGHMVGQFRVGRAIARIRSGLLYSGWDLTRINGTSPVPVWIQFFDRQRSSCVELICKTTDDWRQYRHPAFVPVIGRETLPDHTALVAMEVGEGATLTERLAIAPMTPFEVTNLAHMLCEGLADAHQRGLLHLGISCATVLVPKFDDQRPSLFGFDIPVPPESNFESWPYLAPEQLAESSDCDQRADIYALGIVMFRCLASRYPFDGTPQSASEAFELVAERRRDLRDRVPSEAAAIAEIVEQCIQADRANRFQTTAALSDAICSCLKVLPKSGTALEQGIVLSAPASQGPKRRATADQATLRPSPATDAVSGAAGSSRKPAEEDLVGLQIKEYRVERLLEEGGSSRIYLTTHCRLPRQWVLKVAKGPRVKDVGQWFEQEARVTAVLRQQGERVVEVADWDRLPDGRPYIVMEFIEGRSLAKALAAKGMFPVDEALETIYRVCETLEHAHNLGFLHRDIKPANILLEEKRGRRTDNVVVLDWGMARGAGKERIKITDAGTVLGTAGYRAPEAPLGLDGRADTFSAATVLYEMLAGRPAFVGSDEVNLVIAVNTVYPESLATVRPGISQALSDLVAAGMTKDPEKRPDMHSFRRSLFNHIDQMESRRSVAGSSGPLRRILAGTPTLTVPGVQIPTRAVFNSENREILHRLIEPERQRPLSKAARARTPETHTPAPHSARKRTRLSNIVAIVGILVIGIGGVAAVYRLRHRAPATVSISSNTTTTTFHATPTFGPERRRSSLVAELSTSLPVTLQQYRSTADVQPQPAATKNAATTLIVGTSAAKRPRRRTADHPAAPKEDVTEPKSAPKEPSAPPSKDESLDRLNGLQDPF